MKTHTPAEREALRAQLADRYNLPGMRADHPDITDILDAIAGAAEPDYAAERVARLIDFIKEIDQAAKFQAAKRLSQCGTDDEARDVLAQLEDDCNYDVD